LDGNGVFIQLKREKTHGTTSINQTTSLYIEFKKTSPEILILKRKSAHHERRYEVLMRAGQ